MDFEPFGGTRPEDWETEKLDKCTSEVIRGFTSKYVEKSNLINLNQKVNKGQYLEKQYYKFLDETISVPKEKYAHKKDILLNSLGQGTLGRIHFWYETSTNVVVDQHITIIRAKKGVSVAEYLYLLLSSSKYTDYFESCITGTTGMLMLNISAVRNADIMLPSIEIQEKFANTVEALYEKIEQNNQENTRLAAIRDALLPKLMSGEIDVSNVDISALTSTDKLSFRCRSPPKKISYHFSRYFPLGSVICDFFIRQFVEFFAYFCTFSALFTGYNVISKHSLCCVNQIERIRK